MGLIQDLFIGKEIVFLYDVGYPCTVHEKGSKGIIVEVNDNFGKHLRFYTQEVIERYKYKGWLYLGTHFELWKPFECGILIKLFENDIKILSNG